MPLTEERRNADRRSEVAHMQERLNALEAGHVLLNQKIDINTNLTAGVKEDTSELVELLKSMKAFGKFLSAVATGSKWFTAIAAACAMIYALMHGVLPSSGK